MYPTLYPTKLSTCKRQVLMNSFVTLCKKVQTMKTAETNNKRNTVVNV